MESVGPITSQQASHDFPGAVSRIYTHATGMIVLTLAVVIAAGFLFFPLYVAFTQR